MAPLKVGRGTEPDVDVGPLIDERAAREGGRAGRGRARGAAPRLRARWACVAGRRLLLSNRPSSPACPRTRACCREEIFGPVAPIATFSTEEQALEAANRTEYGLVAYVYTRDLYRALRVCEGIETGMVGLNQGIVSNPAAPFGGVKQSGFGREGGFEGIGEYLETKYVAVGL